MTKRKAFYQFNTDVDSRNFSKDSLWFETLLMCVKNNQNAMQFSQGKQ